MRTFFFTCKKIYQLCGKFVKAKHLNFVYFDTTFSNIPKRPFWQQLTKNAPFKIVKVGNTALQRSHVTWLTSLNNMLILLIKALLCSLYLMVPTCHVIEKQPYIWVLLNVFHSVLFFLISFGMLSMSLEEKLFIQLWMNGQRPQWPDLYGNWFF